MSRALIEQSRAGALEDEPWSRPTGKPVGGCTRNGEVLQGGIGWLVQSRAGQGAPREGRSAARRSGVRRRARQLRPQSDAPDARARSALDRQEGCSPALGNFLRRGAGSLNHTTSTSDTTMSSPAQWQRKAHTFALSNDAGWRRGARAGRARATDARQTHASRHANQQSCPDSVDTKCIH